MLIVEFDLIGISPISFSAPIKSIRDTGESHDDFEKRTWRERLHIDENGEVFIPPSNLKVMLCEVASFLSEHVPGKGNATYTKHFEAGTMVTETLKLGIKADEVEGERLYVPSDGKKGGKTRVYKTFPYIPKWQTHGQIILLDPLLTGKPEKVEEYLKHAGKFIGLGRFRPRNRGYYGRFEVRNFKIAS